MRNIIAGPWFGEFGWELMRWQGIFRHIKENNPNIKIVMVGKPGNEGLYLDYADEYIGIEGFPGGETDGWRVNNQVPTIGPALRDKYKDYIYMSSAVCMRGLKQSFIKYGVKQRGSTDILIHPRATTKCGTSYRNWGEDNWSKLVTELQSNGYSVGTIGNDGGEIHDVEGLNSHNGLPLVELSNIIASAKLVIGPSSGPMHLASLCGTPHLLWTDRKFWGSCNGTNRQRYEKNWNPLGTPAYVIDEYEWSPPVEAVLNKTLEIIDG